MLLIRFHRPHCMAESVDHDNQGLHGDAGSNHEGSHLQNEPTSFKQTFIHFCYICYTKLKCFCFESLEVLNSEKTQCSPFGFNMIHLTCCSQLPAPPKGRSAAFGVPTAAPGHGSRIWGTCYQKMLLILS